MSKKSKQAMDKCRSIREKIDKLSEERRVLVKEREKLIKLHDKCKDNRDARLSLVDDLQENSSECSRINSEIYELTKDLDVATKKLIEA